MGNNFFSFKQFTIHQENCSLRVSTDSCILGAWFANQVLAPEKILDIGSGSGLLMLMLAQKIKGSIKGIEIDPDCYTQSIENIAKSPWAERCAAVQGDARTFNFNESFDFIISNPPFYENQLEAGKEKSNIAKHSTHLGLTELFNAVNALLTQHGKFGVLLPHSRKEEAIQIAEKLSLYCSEVLMIKHTTHHDYFRVILQFERNIFQSLKTSNLTVRDENGNYSHLFTELLKDYYLYL